MVPPLFVLLLGVVTFPELGLGDAPGAGEVEGEVGLTVFGALCAPWFVPCGAMVVGVGPELLETL
jgi:hypothetical protein